MAATGLPRFCRSKLAKKRAVDGVQCAWLCLVTRNSCQLCGYDFLCAYSVCCLVVSLRRHGRMRPPKRFKASSSMVGVAWRGTAKYTMHLRPEWILRHAPLLECSQLHSRNCGLRLANVTVV